MTMYSDELLFAMQQQDRYFTKDDLSDLTVAIELINNEVYPLCFIVKENERYLNIVKTSLPSGREKIIVLNKEAIAKISVVYSDDIIIEKKEESDCMFN